MPTSTLFSLDREPLNPDKNRREPVVWLQRMVILSALDSSTLIRNIPFRRGLNIIKTQQMKDHGGPVAGHSVGKTLLMRMIRYTLGEPTFGTEETQQNLADTAGLESSCVVAHWAVLGSNWIVVRPLRIDTAHDSYSVHSGNWQNAVDSPDDKLAHRDFVQAVNEAVTANLPRFSLPRGRDVKWLDVLAWLSRDYQCGYRKANEWRHDDSHSGPSLDREENSLVMQWLMGLLNADEIDLRLKHNEILKQRGNQRRSADHEQKKLETLWAPLRQKLELSEEAEVGEEQASFASVNPAAIVSDKVASLQRLRQEQVNNSRIQALEQAHKQAILEVSDAEGVIGECSGLRNYLKKQIGEYEADPTKPYARCKAEKCWIKERAKETANDPAKDDHLADLRQQLVRTEQQLEDARHSKKKLVSAATEAKQQLENEQFRLADELAGIDQLIGRWRGVENEAVSFRKLERTVTRLTKTLSKANRDYEESLKTLDDLRQKARPKLNRFSGVYVRVLQEIFGPEAAGRIQVDGNGLQPIPDNKLAPAGAALSVMTTVLAFDVSCLAASVYGLGQHPRFLMHDSPREGDMEGPLFRRLFEIIHELEGQFTDSEDISFQYIVTTTSEPPTHLTERPYVILTLDATDDKNGVAEGRLMKRKF